MRNDVVLDLWFGDALTSFQIIHQSRSINPNLTPKVNAWFLDGFAPSKNSELWSDELFDTIKKLSADHATLATFTSAGFVRRGLQVAGFVMAKKKDLDTSVKCSQVKCWHKPYAAVMMLRTTI